MRRTFFAIAALAAALVLAAGCAESNPQPSPGTGDGAEYVDMGNGPVDKDDALALGDAAVPGGDIPEAHEVAPGDVTPEEDIPAPTDAVPEIDADIPGPPDIDADVPQPLDAVPDIDADVPAPTDAVPDIDADVPAPTDAVPDIDADVPGPTDVATDTDVPGSSDVATDGPGKCGDPDLYKDCKWDLPQENCVETGGTWGPGGLNPNPFCHCPTGDGGCPCHSENDCASLCLVPFDQDCSKAKAGECSPTFANFGCFCILMGPGDPPGAICID